VRVSMCAFVTGGASTNSRWNAHELSHAYVWHDPSIYGTYVWHYSIMCVVSIHVALLIHMCDSLTQAPWFIHLYHIRHTCHMTWLIHLYHIRVTWLYDIRVTWLIHSSVRQTCDMTQSVYYISYRYVSHAVYVGETCRTYEWELPRVCIHVYDTWSSKSIRGSFG